MYPPRATSAAIATLKAQYDERLQQWEEYNAIMQALENQLIAAIDNAYLQGIKDPTTEYHNVSVLQMLKYLYDNYGQINEQSKSKNLEQMKEPYNVTAPIEFFSVESKTASISQVPRVAHLQPNKSLIWRS